MNKKFPDSQPVPAMTDTLIVFHRCGGRSLNYPPNTLLTIKWALGYGAKAIEYDIVFCRDNDQARIIVVEPRVIKEAGLDINNLQWADVEKLDAGNDIFGYQKIPQLEEVLEVAKSIQHQIHIKGNHPQTIPTLLNKLQGTSTIIVTSFDLDVLKKVKQSNRQLRVGWIVKPTQEKGDEGMTDLTAQVTASANALPSYSSSELDEILHLAKEHSIDVVILCAPRIKEQSIIDTIKNDGFECGAWGVGTNLDIAKTLIRYNIDRFTIDNPEELK